MFPLTATYKRPSVSFFKTDKAETISSFLSSNEKERSLASGDESAKETIIHLGSSWGFTTLLKGLCVIKGHIFFSVKNSLISSLDVELRFPTKLVLSSISLSISIMISCTALLSP